MVNGDKYEITKEEYDKQVKRAAKGDVANRQIAGIGVVKTSYIVGAFECDHERWPKILKTDQVLYRLPEEPEAAVFVVPEPEEDPEPEEEKVHNQFAPPTHDVTNEEFKAKFEASGKEMPEFGALFGVSGQWVRMILKGDRKVSQPIGEKFREMFPKEA
jgi:hypothetical protein